MKITERLSDRGRAGAVDAGEDSCPVCRSVEQVAEELLGGQKRTIQLQDAGVDGRKWIPALNPSPAGAG
jgi:hypothetical protein